MIDFRKVLPNGRGLIGVVAIYLILYASAQSNPKSDFLIPAGTRSAPGQPIPPRTPADCPNRDISDVIQIHLRANLISQMLDGTLACTSGLPCVTLNKVDGNGADDDDNGTGTERPPPDYNAESQPIWQTPFDVELSDLWQQAHGTNLHKPILIKVILEDDGLRFYRPNDVKYQDNLNSTGVAAHDSSWALRAGGDNQEMFFCRGPIILKGEKSANGVKQAHSYVTVRVRWTEYGTAQHRRVLSGLNIGLLFKLKSNKFIPLYIDPITHGNG